jgi:hypothetical protein
MGRVLTVSILLNFKTEVEVKVKNKLLDIISKLENISLKEIECISEFLSDCENSNLHEVDEKTFSKLEFIRDNYNKILLNIQKMISSSSFLLEMRENYDKNKASLFEYINDREYETGSESGTRRKIKSKNGPKEWLEKLDSDLETLDRDKGLSIKIKNGADKQNLSCKKKMTKEYKGKLKKTLKFFQK